LLAIAAAAQPLPQVELRPVFPKLKIDRPLWLSETPDGSHRMFLVYQAGKIMVVNQGSDGGDAKEFLNFEGRHPQFNNEDGLLSLAFSSGIQNQPAVLCLLHAENSAEQRPNAGLSLPERHREMKVSATGPDQADTNSERILLAVPQPFWNHKGGELCFGPDGYLYLGLGDGGSGGDPHGNGQKPGHPARQDAAH